MISSLYASLLAIIFIILSARVIKIRRQERISLGDGGNQKLQRAIRTHGNFCEITPIFLILLILAEVSGVKSSILHISSALFLIGRISHAVGISYQTSSFRFRVGGMMLSFSSIIILCFTNLVLFFFSS